MGQPTQAAADVAAGLAEVRERIAAAARAAGRDPAGVTLVAVSKTQPPERVEAALAAGQRGFGGNYVQEAGGRRAPPRGGYPGGGGRKSGGPRGKKGGG